MRAFRRAFTAGQVPVCYSQGFNPHPKLSFGPSLRTGWEGLGEYMDVDLECAVHDLPERCNHLLPEGLDIVESVEIVERTPKLSTDIQAARYQVLIDPADFSNERNPVWAAFAGRHGLASLPASDDRVVTALRGDIDARFGAAAEDQPALVDIHILTKDGSLCIDYLSTMRQGKSLFPEDMLEPILGPMLEQETPWRVTRKELLVARDGAYHAPTSVAATAARS
jgi:hypothetical protein